MATRKTRWALLLAINSLAVLLAFELAGRVNYFTHHDLSFWTPATQLWYRFYPDLKEVIEERSREGLRVLIMGGSTLNHGFCDVDDRLQQGLSAKLNRDVRVINLAMPAQGTLDGWYKYRRLREVPFDLVLIYHGINELRANYVPDDLWRDDYSHYAWYDEVNFLARHETWARWGWVTPFYVQHKIVAFDRKVWSRHRKTPYNAAEIRPDWMGYGATIKSVVPFRHNLERTIALAQEKGEPVVLMTFAYAIPPGYSKERYYRGELGFDRSRKGEAAELWGRPEDIERGLEAHNTIIRELAPAHRLPLVDAEALMGHDPSLFIDVCHFSPAGAQRLTELLLAELERQPLERHPRQGRS